MHIENLFKLFWGTDRDLSSPGLACGVGVSWQCVERGKASASCPPGSSSVTQNYVCESSSRFGG